eukprot:1142773-Pelagomonas_calceolata.AAC.2
MLVALPTNRRTTEILADFLPKRVAGPLRASAPTFKRLVSSARMMFKGLTSLCTRPAAWNACTKHQASSAQMSEQGSTQQILVGSRSLISEADA